MTGSNQLGRWNLYPQIAIENATLKCAFETYALTDICHSFSSTQPCTLKDTNNVVDIGIAIQGR